MSVIDDRMRFDTFNDFYIRRKIIKGLFENLNADDREIYKYYLYANSLLSEMKKDCMWEYLVEPMNFYTTGKRDLRRYYNKGSDKIGYRGRDTK